MVIYLTDITHRHHTVQQMKKNNWRGYGWVVYSVFGFPMCLSVIYYSLLTFWNCKFDACASCTDMEDLTSHICWQLVNKEGYIAIWQKPFNNSCYMSRNSEVQPHVCDSEDQPNNVWYIQELYVKSAYG